MVFSDRAHLGRPETTRDYLEHMAGVLAPVKARLLELLAPRAHDRVLDIGCGAGHDLAALGELGVIPIGVDFSAHLLQASRERCDHALLARADGHDLPLRSASIDGCRIERVLQHVDDPLAVLQEVARVLRPGGRFVAFEPDWQSFVIESDDHEFAPQVTRTIASHFRQPHIGAELGRLVTAAGFDSVECIPNRSEVSSFDTLRQRVGIDGILDRASRTGALNADAVRAWTAEMASRSSAGTFRSTLDRTFVAAISPRARR